MPNDNPFETLSRHAPPVVVGRDETLREIIRDTTGIRPIPRNLVGVPGFGASTLLHYISEIPLQKATWYKSSNQNRESVNDFVPIYVDFSAFPEGMLVRWFLNRVIESRKLEHYLKMTPEEELTIPTLLESLTAARSDGKRVVFLFDHLDRIFVDIPNSQVQPFRPLTRYAGMVAATHRPLVSLGRLKADSMFGDNMLPLYLYPLDRSDVRLLLNQAQGIDKKWVIEIDRYVLPWTGLFPHFVLRGASEWYIWRKRHPQIAPEDLSEDFLRDKLLNAFRPDFVRIWKSLEPSYREIFTNLPTFKQATNLPGFGRQILDNLETWGLINLVQDGTYVPFSVLWTEFVRQEIDFHIGTDPVVRKSRNSEELAPQEKNLLIYMRQHEGQICSDEELLREVWHIPVLEQDIVKRHLLRQTMMRLRKKREKVFPSGQILNHRGKGYEYRE